MNTKPKGSAPVCADDKHEWTQPWATADGRRWSDCANCTARKYVDGGKPDDEEVDDVRSA